MSTVRPLTAQVPDAPPQRAPDSSAPAGQPAFAGVATSGPQLSDLGKRIEMLRVDRGVSKQLLARAAGTSRQQLWRVMTGKSELTSTLCQRLASVLDVDSRTLSSAALAGDRYPHSTVRLSPPPLSAELLAAHSLAEYLESSTPLIRTMRTLPLGDDGIALKCAVINCLEERARASRIQIPAWLFRVRASVLDGSL
jgi:transcriptional regulator with XRE-family HTH domain